jgi:hypothetical protein
MTDTTENTPRPLSDEENERLERIDVFESMLNILNEAAD